ncbi:mdm2-binding protein-like isoform X2 [Apostichopus japonicus]
MHNLNFNQFVQRKPKYVILLCLETFQEKPFAKFLEKLFYGRFWYAHVAPPSIQTSWSSLRCADETKVGGDDHGQENWSVREQIAEALHSLVDQLPVKGFQLDVFWYIPDVTAASVDQNVALLGALKRLHAWHGAQISIVEMNDHSSVLSDWLSLLEARNIVLNKQERPTLMLRRRVIWRGNLKLSEGKNNASLSLPGFQLSSIPQHGSAAPCERRRNKAVVKGMHILSDRIEVVNIVNLDEVPRSFLLSEHMILSLPADGILPRSFQFLSWLKSTRVGRKIAIVLELPYITCTKRLPTCASAGLGTSDWKQQLANNSLDFSVPEIKMRAKHGSQYLLLYLGPSGQCIVQSFVPLKKLNGAVPAKIAEMTSLGCFRTPGSHVGVVNQLPKRIPVVCEQVLWEFLEHLQFYNIGAVLILKARRRRRGYTRPITHLELIILQLLIHVKLFRYSPFLMNSIGFFGDIFPSLTTSNPPDVLDTELVLERLALVNGEQAREKRKREMQEVQLAGMMVPPPIHDTITLQLNASEFLKHFHPSGLPIGQDFSPIGIATRSQSHTSTPSKHRTRPNLQEEELKNLEFPESLKYNLPGFHYCIDQEAMDTDTRMARLILRVVTMETASTCSHNATTSVIKLQRGASVTKATSKRKVPTPRKPKVRCNSKSPRRLKRPRHSNSGATPRKRIKGSRDHGINSSVTARKQEHQGELLTVTPRKSMRLQSPLKGIDQNLVSTPTKSDRFSTPKKVKNDETPRRSKRLETPTKTETGQSKNGSVFCAGRSNLRRAPPHPPPRVQSNSSPYKGNSSPRKQPSIPSNIRRKSLATAKERNKRAAGLVPRSEKHKRKLMEIVSKVLASKGLDEAHSYYKKCFTRLYDLSKSYVKDLKSSRHLYKEMEQIAQDNADFVVKFELRDKNTL